MTLYPQPMRQQAGSGVEYLPAPRRRAGMEGEED